MQLTKGFKPPLQVFFLKLLMSSNIPEIPPKILQNCLFLFHVTGSSPEFPTSTKTDSKKNVSRESSEI